MTSRSRSLSDSARIDEEIEALDEDRRKQSLLTLSGNFRVMKKNGAFFRQMLNPNEYFAMPNFTVHHIVA